MDWREALAGGLLACGVLWWVGRPFVWLAGRWREKRARTAAWLELRRRQLLREHGERP